MENTNLDASMPVLRPELLEGSGQEILVLGIGNYLMGDEGVGVHAAEQLSNMPLPPGVEVLDGGTGGIHLMGLIEPYREVIMIDATLDERGAGSIRLIQPRFSTEFPRAMSTHDIGLRDVVEALNIRGSLPHIYLYLVSVDTLQPMTIELSEPIAIAVSAIVHQIHQFLWQRYELLKSR